MTRLLPAAALLLVAAGCSHSNLPALHPVTGTVMRGGQPLHQAQVRLMPTQTPAGGEVIITGMTNEQGVFTLKTIEVATNRDGQGVPAGTYKLHIDLPVAANQSGGGYYESPNQITIQAGENSLGTIDVSPPPKK